MIRNLVVTLTPDDFEEYSRVTMWEEATVIDETAVVQEIYRAMRARQQFWVGLFSRYGLDPEARYEIHPYTGDLYEVIE